MPRLNSRPPALSARKARPKRAVPNTKTITPRMITKSQGPRSATTIVVRAYLQPMKIAVVGAGAMGSVYAGLLGSAGNEVWAIDTWREHVEAVRRDGLRVEGASGDRVVRIHATTEAAEAGEAELVILATKAVDVENAAEAARPLVGRDTLVLSIQNGLGGPDIAARVLGDDRVAVGVAGGFGASIVAPGHAHHHGLELIRLGERHGPVT